MWASCVKSQLAACIDIKLPKNAIVDTHDPVGDLGNFVGTSTIHNAWAIAAKKVPTDATPHHLASVQIRGGRPTKVLQALLGHKSAVETWDTYGHLMGDEDIRSRAIVDAPWRPFTPRLAMLLRK